MIEGVPETCAVKFVVHGEPIAQPRHKVRVIPNKKDPSKPFVSHYIPGKHGVHDWKWRCRSNAEQVMEGRSDSRPFVGALRLDLTFILPRPSTLVWKTKAMPRLWHTKLPDTDNLAKAVMDSWKDVLWEDDKQVADLRASKHIAAGDESPRLIVVLTELP